MEDQTIWNQSGTIDYRTIKLKGKVGLGLKLVYVGQSISQSGGDLDPLIELVTSLWSQYHVFRVLRNRSSHDCQLEVVKYLQVSIE